jgi:putative AbiEi antitoxin of type IV toxin-antitoxin system
MDPSATARQAERRRGALAKRERELAALANRQHGVISRRQLIAGGLGARSIGRRIESGRLRVLHGGVYGPPRDGTSGRGGGVGGERGQGTVEWVGTLAVVAVLLAGMLAAGMKLPGAELARAVASRLLCAAALADRCGDEPALIAAYGSDLAGLIRAYMPSLLFERGSRALPVDFRRCRRSACGDGSARGLVDRTDAGLPVTAFVRVIDCREAGSARPTSPGFAANGVTSGLGAAGPEPDCSGPRAGSLYIQYWTYYADSATLRGVPIAGVAGYHRDDWETVQVRIRPGGRVEARASSHHGYNYLAGAANWGSDLGVGAVRDASETVGARPHNGWGPTTGWLLVSGGSHAGNVGGFQDVDRIVPAARVHLVALEPIVAEADGYRFAVSPPWRKQAWLDPEAGGTD